MRTAITVVLCLALTAPFAAAQGSVETDRAALDAIYGATGGDSSWSVTIGWPSPTEPPPLVPPPLSDRYGVHVDGDGRVERLVLFSNGLTGALPPEVGRLSRLRELNTWFNPDMTGPLPAEIGDLAELRIIDMGISGKTGGIPPELGRLANLEYLDLGGTDSGPNSTSGLSGGIPPELGRLSKLKYLHLTSNQLSGPIPYELANLTAIEDVTLDGHTGLCLPRDFPESPVRRRTAGGEMPYCIHEGPWMYMQTGPGSVVFPKGIETVNMRIRYDGEPTAEVTAGCAGPNLNVEWVDRRMGRGASTDITNTRGPLDVSRCDRIYLDTVPDGTPVEWTVTDGSTPVPALPLPVFMGAAAVLAFMVRRRLRRAP